MSTNHIALNPGRVPSMPGTPNLIFWMVTLSLIPALALFGGMKFLILGLALGLALIVWIRPREAPVAGMLFLFAASIILPFSARLDITAPIWQMYYWAVGLLIITLAAVLRIGPGRIWMVPRSAKAFLAVATLATLYGWMRGASLSYVLRQYYGILLLVVFLGIALRVGSQELLIRRIATFGVFCVVCFLVYYASIFSEYGFHKEMGANGIEAVLMAALLLLVGLERKKRSWVVVALFLLLVPVLLFMRSDVLTFLIAATVGLGMGLKSRRRRLLCYSAAALMAVPAMYPPVTGIVGRAIVNAPVVGNFVPHWLGRADSLIGRVAEMDSAIQTLRAHPLLGNGMGAELTFTLPTTGKIISMRFVDSGWGYLVQKMGLMGTAAFIWLLVTIFSSISRESIALSACLLTVSLVTLFSQPIFFHFTTAPYIGTYAGLLLAQKRRRELAASRRSKSLIPAVT